MIRQIDATVKRMEVSGEPITKKVVADKLGRDRKGLQHYPAASAFLEQAVMDAQARQFQRRTEDILDRMNAVIARMEDQNERATVSAVAEELQMSVGSLRYYPQVRPMLKSLVQGQANDTEIKLQARDRRLVEKVEKAVEKQESQGDPVNYQVVSEMTAISIKVLKRRIQLRQIIEEAIIRSGQVATALSQE